MQEVVVQGAEPHRTDPWYQHALWMMVIIVSLVLVGYGLLMTIVVAPTDEALAGARTGRVAIMLGCVLLVLAGWVGRLLRMPSWVVLAVASPVWLTGALALLASGSLLPQLSFLLTSQAALVGSVLGLVCVRTPPGARSGRAGV